MDTKAKLGMDAKSRPITPNFPAMVEDFIDITNSWQTVEIITSTNIVNNGQQLELRQVNQTTNVEHLTANSNESFSIHDRTEYKPDGPFHLTISRVKTNFDDKRLKYIYMNSIVDEPIDLTTYRQHRQTRNCTNRDDRSESKEYFQMEPIDLIVKKSDYATVKVEK